MVPPPQILEELDCEDFVIRNNESRASQDLKNQVVMMCLKLDIGEGNRQRRVYCQKNHAW